MTRRLPVINKEDVIQIPFKENTSLKKGDVILVKSDYKYEKYGDHFSIIVGGLIQKDRGLRPNLITLPKTNGYKWLLSKFKPDNGVIVLKLSPFLAKEVMQYYGLHLSEGDIITDRQLKNILEPVL